MFGPPGGRIGQLLLKDVSITLPVTTGGSRPKQNDDAGPR
jgi:hypothetical protein